MCSLTFQTENDLKVHVDVANDGKNINKTNFVAYSAT